MEKGKKISILGAGRVGSTIAYTLTMQGLASEVVLVDIDGAKAEGEAMDIIQGTAFSAPINLYAGSYEDTKNSDIIIVTVGIARKPGQSRLDLAQSNVDTIKQLMPLVTKHAPDAIYVIVSNPVDILTYVITKICGLPRHRIIGSGTILDSARLRSIVSSHVGISTKNVHGYVLGEHGDTAVIPWSMVNISGTNIRQYSCDGYHCCPPLAAEDFKQIEEEVRTAGARVIARKGATYYAVSLSVQRICEAVLRDTDSVLTVSSLLEGQYGIDDICMSLPYVIGARGIKGCIVPPLTDEEEKLMNVSANALKTIRDGCNY